MKIKKAKGRMMMKKKKLKRQDYKNCLGAAQIERKMKFLR